jgi:hypothetical protein
MLALTNQFAQLSFDKVDPADVAALSPEAQAALNTLIDCNAARVEADARKAAAIKRVALASTAETKAATELADASMPIAFTPDPKWTPAELKSAREAHDLRCRQHLEHEARRRASGTNDADGVATLDPATGKWSNVVPEKKTGHAKTKGPSSFKIAMEKSAAEVTAAQTELHAATELASRTSKLEADALGKFQALERRQTPDELLREAAQRSQEQRAANVAAGFPPGGIVQRSHGSSPIDQLAATRPRNAGPLRSTVVRRVV